MLIRSSLEQLGASMRLINWENYIPKLIDFTLRAWDNEMKFPNARGEDIITLHLKTAMERLQRQERWMESILISGQQEQLDPNTDSLLGRTDLKFHLGSEHDFTWECKILQKAGSSKYSEYRKEGMMRFLTGKYKCSDRVGGMLAYVLDKDVSETIEGLNKSLSKKSADIASSSPVLKAYEDLDEESLRVSEHDNEYVDEIIHAFLKVK